MADQQHLELLQQKVGIWNAWRMLYPEICPDLSGADLNGLVLSGLDLSGADLHRADLHQADLSKIILSQANLSRTILTEANLLSADLSGANLSEADLCLTIFLMTNLNSADLEGARVGFTVFGEIDLRTVKGLETIKHLAPSTIGTNTISRSEEAIPERFLRLAGVTNTFITNARPLAQNPIEYYTCFISYSSKDEDFAKRVYTDLQSNGVRCWFTPEDIDIGDKIRSRIDESIHLYDKLQVVFSEHSIASYWVAYEVEKALDKEPEGIPNVLFPIRLDNAVLTCGTQWAKEIRRSRHIGDFERWKEHDEYQKSFSQLLRALKQSQKAQRSI